MPDTSLLSLALMLCSLATTAILLKALSDLRHPAQRHPDRDRQ